MAAQGEHGEAVVAAFGRSQILAALDQAFGLRQGFRPNHAKGVVVEGRFRATPEAAGLSKARPFDGSEIPVTARFSDATGIAASFARRSP